MRKKQVLFREVNDRIREVNMSFGDGPSYHLLCECPDVDCIRRVVVPRRVYDELHRDPSRYLISPEHVVNADGAFLVVSPATG